MPKSELENARVVNSNRMRLGWMSQGGESCAVCGWSGPKSLWRKKGLVQPHHILGTSTLELIFDATHQLPLCPNHHVIAHAAWPEKAWKHNYHPTTREELIRLLVEYDHDNLK